MSRQQHIHPPLTSDELLRHGFRPEENRPGVIADMVSRILSDRNISPGARPGIAPPAPQQPVVPVITESAEFPWSVKDVCRQLGISKSTLKRWHAEGLVPDPPARVAGNRGGRKANRYGPEWMTEARANLGYPSN